MASHYGRFCQETKPEVLLVDPDLYRAGMSFFFGGSNNRFVDATPLEPEFAAGTTEFSCMRIVACRFGHYYRHRR
jgi:hypothetical protein